LTQLRRLLLDPFDFVEGFQRLGQILLDQFILRGKVFLFTQRIKLALNISTLRLWKAVIQPEEATPAPGRR